MKDNIINIELTMFEYILLTIAMILPLIVIVVNANCWDGINGTEGVVGPSGPNIINGELYGETFYNSTDGTFYQMEMWLEDMTKQDVERIFNINPEKVWDNETNNISYPKLIQEKYGGPKPYDPYD